MAQESRMLCHIFTDFGVSSCRDKKSQKRCATACWWREQKGSNGQKNSVSGHSASSTVENRLQIIIETGIYFASILSFFCSALGFQGWMPLGQLKGEDRPARSPIIRPHSCRVCGDARAAFLTIRTISNCCHCYIYNKANAKKDG